jgi:type III pantothenate kinase
MMMLLAVDVGNTHTVLGLFEGQRLIADWRVATRHDVTCDELGVIWRSLVERSDIPGPNLEGMIVSSVVPDLDSAIAKTGERYFGQRPLFVGPGIKTGLPILYENPHEVGADRIVNAVAAKERYGAPVVVLDFGTGTTFDVVSAKGEYVGGLIAPGLGASAEALFSKAARLHRVEFRRPERVVGRNTEQSLRAGLYFGYLALVEGLISRINASLDAPAPVVATGGLAAVFERDLEVLHAVDPGLTLEGLRLIWDRNRR